MSVVVTYTDGDFSVKSRPSTPCPYTGRYWQNAWVIVKYRNRIIFQGGAADLPSGIYRGRVAIADWKAKTDYERAQFLGRR